MKKIFTLVLVSFFLRAQPVYALKMADTVWLNAKTFDKCAKAAEQEGIKNGKFFKKKKNMPDCLVHLLNGNLEGVAIDFYSNGNVKQRSNYKNGLLDGESILYTKKGSPEVIANFKEGKRHGVSRIFNVWSPVSGPFPILLETSYSNDVIDGKQKYFYRPTGLLIWSDEYKNGKKHGKSIVFNTNTVAKTISKYEEGKLISSVSLSTDSYPGAVLPLELGL